MGQAEWQGKKLTGSEEQFIKPVNSFIDANGDVQWGAMGPIMGMNGPAHISHAVSNLYHGYNHGIGGNIGHMGVNDVFEQAFCYARTLL